MNSMELLEAIGSVKDSHVAEAREEPERKRLSLRRPLLVAVVAALMLVLVGCAVVVLLGLNDLKLGGDSHTDKRTGQTEVWDIVSLQGVVGSKEYMAAKEWYDFKTENEKTYDDTAISEEYISYGCASQAWKDKVDKICEAYDLKLLGEMLEAGNTLEMLGIGSIWNEAVEMETEFIHDGYYFRGGTFQMEGTLKLTGEESPWAYPVRFQIRCVMKGYFDSVFLNVGDIASYDQWEYEQADGTVVLLAVNEDKALILADREDFFVTVNILNPTVGNRVLGKASMDRTALEAVADAFDFSFRPREVTEEMLLTAEEAHAANYAIEQEKWQEQYDKAVGKESYAARVKYYLENDSEPEQLGFAFYDMDGNGVEELLIGKDGYYINIYTEKDGTTEEYLDEGTYSYGYLCEDHVAVSVIDITATDYYVNRVVDFEKQLLAHIQYNPTAEDGKWRLYTDWNRYELISEAEYYEKCLST